MSASDSAGLRGRKPLTPESAGLPVLAAIETHTMGKGSGSNEEQ